jgi:hypothetical protein
MPSTGVAATSSCCLPADRLYRAKATGRNRALGVVDALAEGVTLAPAAPEPARRRAGA